MKVSDAIAEVLRREGVEIVIGYPVNHVLERGAAAGIRPVLVRQSSAKPIPPPRRANFHRQHLLLDPL